MRIVIFQRKILELEFKDRFHRRIDPHDREGLRFPRKLKFRLIDVIEGEMDVAEGVNEKDIFLN